MFSGSEPNAQQATRQLRLQYKAAFDAFLTSAKFSHGPPSAMTACVGWGSHSDDVNLAQDLFGGGLQKTDSEALGEGGALFYLQKMLAQHGLIYDDNNLRVFAGNGCFNLVYFDPDINNPLSAVILEAKGGHSQLGDCYDLSGTGMRVDQGTPEYADVIMQKMKISSDADRQLVGGKLQQLSGAKPPKVAYVGVRTGYDKNLQKVHDPVPIFFKTV